MTIAAVLGLEDVEMSDPEVVVLAAEPAPADGLQAFSPGVQTNEG